MKAKVNGVSDERPYKDSHYLLFGGADSLVYNALDCSGAAEYLKSAGFAESSLTQARKLKQQSSRYAGYRDPDARYCDFCCRVLTGAEFDVLDDGRERCTACSESVVNSRQEFETLLVHVRDGMRQKYAIDLPGDISVRVVSQKKMARLQGSRYVPTRYFDPRAVGLAISRSGSYSMYFENGAPRGMLTATTAHELTHIWQYSHWNWEAMSSKYGAAFLAVCEGMAKWSEIQYLFLLNETDFALRTLEHESARNDVYGYGLRLFLNRYPLSRGIVITGDTPFKYPNEPITLE